MWFIGNLSPNIGQQVNYFCYKSLTKFSHILIKTKGIPILLFVRVVNNGIDDINLMCSELLQGQPPLFQSFYRDIAVQVMLGFILFSTIKNLAITGIKISAPYP